MTPEEERVLQVAARPPEAGQFSRLALPLVRRIYPQLVANDIVNTQPLLGPTGLVYYLRFRYSETRNGIPSDQIAAPGRKWRMETPKKVDWRTEGF